MQLTFSKSAFKALRAMQPKVARAFTNRLRRIADNPLARHANVEPMTGTDDTFRLRLGDRRAVYVIDREQNQMRVERIASRGDAYQ